MRKCLHSLIFFVIFCFFSYSFFSNNNFQLVSSVWASVSTFNLLTTIGSHGTANGTFKQAKGMDFDSSGNLFVADFSNNRIQKFNSSYTYVTKLGGTSCSTSFFCTPSDIAVDSSNYVIVADTAYHRIKKLANDFSSTIWTVGGTTSGSTDTKFNNPSGVAVDSSDNIYVADRLNYRISKFDSGGNFVTKWGSNGTGDGQFSSLYGITVDSSNNVWTIDASQRVITQFSNTGTFIKKLTFSSGSAPGGMSSPSALDVDSSGNIYVADSSNNRIQKFDNSGNWLATYSTGVYTAGMALDGSGNIFAGEGSSTSGSKIQKFDFTGLAYQVSNLPASLDAINSTSGLNIELGTNYGETAAFTLRLKNTSGRIISDATVTLGSDGDWSSVSADSDQASGKSFVYNLIGAPGMGASHTLYVPIPAGRTSSSVRVCPDATDMTGVNGSCSNGVSLGAGAYTESFGSGTVSQVSSFGDNVTYWSITGVTGTGGISEGLSSFGGSGSGTDVDPYQITTCTELQNMQNEKAAIYQIMNNIDCTGTTAWNGGNGFVPVGSDNGGNSFTGKLIGSSSYAIDGLFIVPQQSGAGLFGYVRGATITNVKLTNIDYTKAGVTYDQIGGIVGYADGVTISGSSTTGLIDSTVAGWSTSEIGGLVGMNVGTTVISNSWSSANIELKDNSFQVGGLIGYSRGNLTVTDSYATGHVYAGPTTYNTAGFIGWLVGTGSISNSYATGEVYIGRTVGFNSGDSFSNAGFIGQMGGSNSYPGTTSITNSYAIGNVRADVIDHTTYHGVWDTAGFVGLMDYGATIDQSHATGSVTIYIDNGSNAYGECFDAGGFAGLMRALSGTGSVPVISNSYSTGNVTASQGNSCDNIGGFIGNHRTGTINNSYATGSVNITPDEGYPTAYVGGFAGYLYDGNISESYATGIVSSPGDSYYIGGFVGQMASVGTGDIDKSYATGDVSGGDYVGGFVGTVTGTSTHSITDAYARGNVTAHASYTDTDAGGFAGTAGLTSITNTYSTGTVTSTLSSIYLGGWSGYAAAATVTDSYWDTQTSGTSSSSGGTGYTTTQMKDQSNFGTWDFSTIWSIDALQNDGYPILQTGASPTPTPTPTATPTPTVAASDTSTPLVLASTTTADLASPQVSCVAVAPVIAPELFSVKRSGTKATLSFSPVNGNTTGYYISYGFSENDEQFGVIYSIDYSSQQISYTVSSLSSSQSYYFKVRAMNNCVPGPWSNIVFVDATSSKQTASPTPSPTPTTTVSETPTPTPTPDTSLTVTIVDSDGTAVLGAAVSVSSTSSNNSKGKPTATPTITETPTLTPTDTVYPTKNPKPTKTPTPTSSPTLTATLTPSPTTTPSASPTLLPTVSPTEIITPEVTATPSPTVAIEIIEASSSATASAELVYIITGSVDIITENATGSAEILPMGIIEQVGNIIGSVLGERTDETGTISLDVPSGDYEVTVKVGTNTFIFPSININEDNSNVVKLPVDNATLAATAPLPRVINSSEGISEKVVEISTDAVAVFAAYSISTSLFTILKSLIPVYAETGKSLSFLPIDLLKSLTKLGNNYVITFFSIFAGNIFVKRKNNGVVFDSKSHSPISGAYVVAYSPSGNLVTDFTDSYGRYKLLPEKDTYKLKSKAINYLYPSQVVRGSDDVYSNVYIPDQSFSVDEINNETIRFSIPMDSLVKPEVSKLFSGLQNGFTRISFLIYSFLFSVLFFASMSPTGSLYKTLFIFLCIHILMKTYQSVFKSGRKYSQ